MTVGLKTAFKRRGKRLRELDREVRGLAVRYRAYKRLFESCMEVIQSQADLIADYATRQPSHVEQRKAEIMSSHGKVPVR